MPLRKRKPTSAGRRFQIRLGLLRDHPVASPSGPWSSPSPAPAAATATGARRPATAVAATSSSTASSTSSGTRTACRPRWRPSSTTPTATPASPCCTTTTARSATSWPRPRCGWATCSQSGQGSEIRPGNALPLRYIPVGSTIHNIELRPGQGGKLARGRRHERPAGGQGGAVRHPAAARPPRCAGCPSTAGGPWARSATPRPS